ncbi:protein C19orf12 homolog [Elgaria multicarinata webbii]|uniref:protein C19orf12 homolog n=1 Tax=Elgaria multicarinata webbii TaxID=159646 RepID=UPI002FCD692C
MPINMNDVMQLLGRVSEVQGMKAALRHSGRGALMAGLGAFLGGMMGGPFGIAIGGAVGGLVGANMSAGQFKPVPQILMELPPTVQQQLYNDAYAILKDFNWTDLAQITALVLANSTLQTKLLGVVTNYLTNELNAEIQYGKKKP